MKKIILFIVLVVGFSLNYTEVKAQVINGAYAKKTITDRKPAPLPDVRESDVIWSKTVWRIIDLREKANQHFYYPVREIQGRTNLFLTLLKGVEEKSITAFDAQGTDAEFKEPITFLKVKEQFGDTVKTIKVTDLNTGADRDTIIRTEIPYNEIKQLEIKEIWYFDKQKSSLQVRTLGICPIRVYKKDPNDSLYVRKRIFWVSYPEVRPLLAKHEVVNELNGARSLSFDDIFLTRQFDAYIVKEENIYNNRSIDEYAGGDYALSESDRIKNAIFTYEQDLWEY
ncbi:MAG: gliding motility protein GldN [Bacteroidia bacterium]|nr:gliding motility protein GldN [Bacteroidia bacterium]